MIIRKYAHSIYLDQGNIQCLDVRTKEASLADPIPSALALNLCSNAELNKIKRQGFATPEGKQVMERIYDANPILAKDKKVIVIGQANDVIGQAFWQHYQPTHSVFIYQGGIKALLEEANQIIEQKRRLVVLHGETGTGKTELLELLEAKNQQVLNLEQLANHHGSTFGNLSNRVQPSQTTFVLKLALTLSKFNPDQVIFSEFEKHSIGKNILPTTLEETLRNASQIRLKLPLEYRIHRLVTQYAGINDDKLAQGIKSLENKLGSADTETLINELHLKNYALVAKGLLKYFDESETYKNLDRNTYDLTLNNEDLESTSKQLITYFN